MRRIAFSLAIALAATAAAACHRDQGAAPAAAVETVTVDDLDRAIAAGQCQPVDANGDGTRQRMGVIPGATLLTDHETYALDQLPPDKAKPLVFYCANESCGASHVAAERARTAGYQHVRVLPAGIAGWVKAGKPVQKI